MKFTSKVLAGLMSVLAVMLLSVSSVFAQAGLNWDTSSVTVVGSGIAPPNAVSAVQARMLARRAAVADAYRQLAETIKGVNVDAETTVENMMVTNDTIKTRVSACIQGATVVGEKEIPGGGYEVTVTVPLFGVTNSVAQAVLPKPPTRVEFPKPEPKVAPAPPVTTIGITTSTTTTTTDTKTNITIPAKPAVTTPAKPATKPTITTPTKPAVTTPTVPVISGAIGGFTGLIVDCRGLGLKPVMSPVIKNADGQSIYGHANLDYDKVIEIGMAGYTTDVNNVARAGSNPLVVKAVRLENHNGNPVISVADANRVLIENGKSGFLEKLNVVFIR